MKLTKSESTACIIRNDPSLQSKNWTLDTRQTLLIRAGNVRLCVNLTQQLGCKLSSLLRRRRRLAMRLHSSSTSRCKQYTTYRKTWRRSKCTLWRRKKLSWNESRKKKASSMQYKEQLRVGRTSGTPSRSRLKWGSALARMYRSKQWTRSWRRSSSSATDGSKEWHMPEIQRRTKCSDNCTLARCFKSIPKAHTWWTLMRVGYQSATSEDVAGTELAKTTQWSIESWDTRSIWSALCLLKAPSGLLRLNATPTKTSCKCFCRS